MQIVAALLAFLLNWFILSFIIWIAARLVAGMEATCVKALIASLVGGIVSAVLWWAFTYLPGLNLFWWAAGIVIFLVYLLIIRFYFDTSCLGALLIAILAFIVYLLLAWLITWITGIYPLP
jgi:hypothetical protein